MSSKINRSIHRKCCLGQGCVKPYSLLQPQRFKIRVALPFGEEAESGHPRRQRPQHRLCPPPLGLWPTNRGSSLVLAELPNRALEIWPIVLLLLLFERTLTGKQAEVGPNRLVRW